MARTIMLIFLLGSMVGVKAQGFWFEPEYSRALKGDSLRIVIREGEDALGQAVKTTKALRQLGQYRQGKWRDLREDFKEGQYYSLVQWVETGMNIYFLEWKKKENIDSSSFSSFVQFHGLEEFKPKGFQNHWVGKALELDWEGNSRLLVWGGGQAGEEWGRVKGFNLELIPLQNPVLSGKGSLVTFRLMFKGHPLFGAKVLVWNKLKGKIFLQPIYSQKDGTVDIRLGNQGLWIVEVMHALPAGEGSVLRVFQSNVVYFVP